MNPIRAQFIIIGLAFMIIGGILILPPTYWIYIADIFFNYTPITIIVIGIVLVAWGVLIDGENHNE